MDQVDITAPLYQRNHFIKVSQPSQRNTFLWQREQKIRNPMGEMSVSMFIISAFMDLQCVKKKK